MMDRVRRRHSPGEGEESEFVALSDLMVGLLFIFIILLVHFSAALQSEVRGSRDARTALLKGMESEILAETGLRVALDPDAGVIGLPEKSLFDSGKDELTAEGRRNLAGIAAILARRLPCHINGTEVAEAPCEGKRSPFLIETLLVEGHTDADKVKGDPTARGNLNLSARRATETFLELTKAQPGLGKLTTRFRDRTLPLLGVAGYGPNRPARDRNGVEIPPSQKSLHRRIELRLIMAPPQPDSA